MSGPDHRRKQLEEQVQAAKRLIAIEDARNNLLKFMQLEMYDPDDPQNPEKSLYQVTPQARLLTDTMMKAESGGIKRLAVSIGPQTGKTQVISKHGIAWIFGRNPRKHIILATYNEVMAAKIGQQVREIIASPTFKQVFPDFSLVKGGESKMQLVSEQGGEINFVGIGGATTGMRADLFIVDDPIKNDEEAQSASTREAHWDWFNSVVSTRVRKHTPIIIVHTRWHEDDLIGRLVDPDHPERNKKYRGIADKWTYLNIPIVVTDPELADALGLKLKDQIDPFVKRMFGEKPMTSLWDEMFPLDLLAEFKQMDERIFNALRMGKPTPDNGSYFTRDMIVEHQDPGDYPDNLRMYGASDHAVSEKQHADYTVMGCIGIDENDEIWVMPDLVWDKMEADRTVEELLAQFKMHKPLLWWMESELISKSFGPFLKKRMMETKTYVTIEKVNVSRDKRTRARAIQGRMAMRKVHFPAFAPWFADAKAQILRFPYGANDDFVDWLSHIGMGMAQEIAADPSKEADTNVVQVGSIQWILASARNRAIKEKREKARLGW